MARDLYWQLFTSGQADLYNMELDATKKIQMMYADAYKSIDSEIQGIYAKYATSGKLTYTEMNKYQRYTSFTQQIDKILGNTLKKKDTTIMNYIEGVYKESFLKSAYATDMVGGSALQWGRFNQKAVEKVMTDPLSKLADSKSLVLDKKTSLYGIRKTITNGLIRGDSYKTMAKNIQDFMGVRDKDGVMQPLKKGEMYKAMRIVRTESNRAIVAGQMDHYNRCRELGLDVDAFWRSQLLKNTRDTHGALDGKARQEKGWYVPSIGWITSPMQSGVASFDINCKCRVDTVVKDYPPEERYVRGDGVKPWVDYKDWKKSVVAKGVYDVPLASGGILNLNIKPSIPITDKDLIQKAVGDAFKVKTMPRDAEAVIVRHHRGVTFDVSKKGSSYYSPSTKSIHLKISELGLPTTSNTVRHEFGHALDYVNGSAFSSSKNFMDLMKNANRAIWSDKQLEQTVRHYVLKHRNHPSLSDFFSALTKNRIVGTYRHIDSYYRNSSWQSVEVFANIFDLYCDQKHWKFIEAHFTNLADSYKMYIRGLK